MDYTTLQNYIDGLVTDVTDLQRIYQSKIEADQKLEVNVAMLGNFLGNAKHYVHELNTSMNGEAQNLILEATNTGIESAQNSLRTIHEEGILSSEEFIVLHEKFANFSLLVRSAIDPDYSS